MHVAYQSIFQKVEQALLRVGSTRRPVEEIRANLEPYRHLENKHLSDDEYFRQIVSIIFYSGFKAATVTARLELILRHLGNFRTAARYGQGEVQAILADPGMIRHAGKIEACVHNAGVFEALVNEYGSFDAYVQTFSPRESAANLMRLRADLQHRFKYLGGITTFHLMTDIGLPVLKPDRVIRRIFYRLGLIESESEDEANLLSTIEQGQRFSLAAQQPIRYIDIVFVAYGQARSDEFGLDSGICLSNSPRCGVCGVREVCGYFSQRDNLTPSLAVHITQPPPARQSAIPMSAIGAVGPIPRSRIVLCAGDAGPGSQLRQSGMAGRFFPGGKWVGAMRNAAARLGCRFVILTTRHGLIEPDTVIEPYDLHIGAARNQVREIWNRTVPRLITPASVDVVVFHAGGCPSEYVDDLRSILQRCGVSLLVFGRPNMVDVGRAEDIVKAIEEGIPLDELRSQLKFPAGLKYFATKPASANAA